MPQNVFISYSAKDQAVAFRTCEALESRGIKCWIAPRNIKPGKEWGEAILDAITETRVMILIFSSNANASSQVRREVERAASSNSTIIPFRIENIAPVKSLEFFLSSIHWLDAFPTPSEEHFKNLADSVSESLPQTDSDKPPEASETKEGIQKPVRSPAVRRLTQSEPFADAVLIDDEQRAVNSLPERPSSAFKRPLPLIIIGVGGLVIAILIIFYLSKSKINLTTDQPNANKTDQANANNLTNSKRIADQNTDNAGGIPPNNNGGGTDNNGGDTRSVNYQGSMPTTSYSVPKSPRSVEKIIILDTATPDMLETLNFLTSGQRNVSYHYVIDHKGTSYSLVDEKNVAFHSSRLSHTSIGIGLIHMPGKEQYTASQRQRLIQLLAEIAVRHKIAPYNILTKQEVDPDRRITDLTPEMIKIRNEVRAESRRVEAAGRNNNSSGNQ